MQSVTTYMVFCDSISVLQLCCYVLVFFPWLNLRLNTQFSLAKTVATVLSNTVFIAFFHIVKCFFTSVMKVCMHILFSFC